MNSEIGTPDPKYLDFFGASRDGVNRIRKWQQAESAARAAVDDLASQFAKRSDGYLKAEVRTIDVESMLPDVVRSSRFRRDFPYEMVFFRTTGTPVQECWICTIKLTQVGFPVFVRWDKGDMHCENASDIYEAIWTTLGNPRIGEFLLRVVPHLYPEDPE